MIITQDGEQTVIDGEQHTTFIKAEKFGVAALHIGAGIEDWHVQHFHWVKLTRNPFKDCWTLLRWYFSRKEVR